MIFVTVGTQLPFNRLARAIDAWCEADGSVQVFAQLGQLGSDDYRPRHFEWCESLSPADFKRSFEQAIVVASHAGMGTIIGALTHSKPLLVMPRRAPVEHRNDHQLATVERLGMRLGVRVALEEPEVPPALADLLAIGDRALERSLGEFAEPTLIDCLREQIMLSGRGLLGPDDTGPETTS